ncbi:unnamed protein product, partial [Allacma fusca]
VRASVAHFGLSWRILDCGSGRILRNRRGSSGPLNKIFLRKNPNLPQHGGRVGIFQVRKLEALMGKS